MDFQLQTSECAFPCEVTCDQDNGRFTVRKADTSGEVFNSADELKSWLEQNWSGDMFTDPDVYTTMLIQLEENRE
ncbi:hypothetical protein [Alteribacter natronophilus]|uniref:hypothetical protein n=1 Tax=Alteribacter natronophilus TaxID=2583810 RepID=UPI00110F11C4|nr:hypothetical protein [Alteribacter natronophilus]TMW73497.1 hypothetical protein FGB90_04140 [Alteribacter natronophilus]